MFVDENGWLYYEYFTKGIIAYCSSNPILLEILKDNGLSPNLENGGIRFTLRKKSSLIKSCKLSLLCFACYAGYITSYETWQKEYKKFRRWMNNFGYQIDHADGNQLNCIEFNLSLMSKELNGKKSSVTRRIKQPAECYCGYYGNEYRIRAVWHIKSHKKRKHGILLKLKCDTARDFVSCLREIEELEYGYGKPMWVLGDNDMLERVTNDRWKENRRCATEDIVNSMIEQAKTAWMFSCEFTPCKAGQVKQLFLEARDG